MNCWHCNKELIWDCDFDTEDITEGEMKGITSFLHCPNCNSSVEIYLPMYTEEEQCTNELL